MAVAVSEHAFDAAVKAGPGDTFRSHRPNEYLTIQELEAGAAFYAALVPAFFRMQVANQEAGAR